MQRAYLDNSEWESTQTPKAKRLTMEALLTPHPTPWPKGPCTPVCSKPLDYPTRQCFSGVGWNCGALGEHVLQMWGNCGSGNQNSHWAATLMPQALHLLLHVVGGGRGGLVHCGGRTETSCSESKSPHVMMQFPAWGASFSLQRIKGVVFHCDTGKGLSPQQFGPSKLSHLGIGLGLNAPCVRLITCGCGDTAC